MKNILTIIILVISVSCVKKTTETQGPTVNPLKVTIAGYKCDMMGDGENKEIFLKVSKKEEKTVVDFHDITDGNKISVIFAQFGLYSVMGFTMSEKIENEAKILTGTGMLLHKAPSTLSDEGKVINVTGKLTLNEDMSGVLEQKLFVSKEDNSVFSTPYMEVAKIENCEKFKARKY